MKYHATKSTSFSEAELFWILSFYRNRAQSPVLDSFIIQKKSRFTSAAKWVAELNSRQKNNTKLLSERHSSHIFFLHFGIIFKYSNTEVTIVGIVHDQMMQRSTFKTKSNENVSMLIYLLNFHLPKIFFYQIPRELYGMNQGQQFKLKTSSSYFITQVLYSLHIMKTVSTNTFFTDWIY